MKHGTAPGITIEELREECLVQDMSARERIALIKSLEHIFPQGISPHTITNTGIILRGTQTATTFLSVYTRRSVCNELFPGIILLQEDGDLSRLSRVPYRSITKATAKSPIPLKEGPLFTTVCKDGYAQLIVDEKFLNLLTRVTKRTVLTTLHSKTRVYRSKDDKNVIFSIATEDTLVYEDYHVAIDLEKYRPTRLTSTSTSPKVRTQSHQE